MVCTFSPCGIRKRIPRTFAVKSFLNVLVVFLISGLEDTGFGLMVCNMTIRTSMQ